MKRFAKQAKRCAREENDMNMLRVLFGASAVGAVLLAGSDAEALTITYDQLPDGTNSVIDVEWSAQSLPRNFKSKNVNGVDGVGVEGGFVDGEVDLDEESILFTFTTPQILSEIVLAFLFKDGNFGDQVSEVARLRISATPFVAGDLSVSTPTTATWSGLGGGAVTNISPGDQNNAGVWRIATPFGTTAVTQLQLTAIPVTASPPVTGSANSDFSFVQLSTAVPEPTTLGLLGAGLAGLAIARRRRRAD